MNMTRISQLHPAIRAYRLDHPASRAENHVTLYGSTGVVRRVTCIYCRDYVTSSAKWPETKASFAFRAAHEATCAGRYLADREMSALIEVVNVAAAAQREVA